MRAHRQQDPSLVLGNAHRVFPRRQTRAIVLGLLVVLLVFLCSASAAAFSACVEQQRLISGGEPALSEAPSPPDECQLAATNRPSEQSEAATPNAVPICSESATSDIAPRPIVALSGASLRAVSPRGCQGEGPHLLQGEQQPRPQAQTSENWQPALLGLGQCEAVVAPAALATVAAFTRPLEGAPTGIRRTIERPPRS